MSKIDFESCLLAASEVRENFFILPLKVPVERINRYLAANRDYQDRINECDKLFQKLTEAYKNGFNVQRHSDLLMQVNQSVGELDFAAVAISKGLDILPVQPLKDEKRSKEQAPDFQTADGSVFFEVKTLAIVNPKENYGEVFHQNRQLNESLDKQIEQGAKYATAIMSHSPYGDKLYDKGFTRGVIETISLKLRSNIKPKQFAKGHTILVCNLYDLSLYGDGRPELCPIHFDQGTGGIFSGVLWMTAFAKPGNLIFSPPESLDKPTIEGATDFCGVLQENCFIKGIVWLSSPLEQREMPQVLLSIRQQDKELIKHGKDGIGKALYDLCGENWNDEVGTNSSMILSKLQEHAKL